MTEFPMRLTVKQKRQNKSAVRLKYKQILTVNDEKS